MSQPPPTTTPSPDPARAPELERAPEPAQAAESHGETSPTSTPAAATLSRDSAGAFASAIRVVSGLTLFSRFAGLARDVVMVRILGDDLVASAFRFAYTLPNLFRRLFGEGALSAAFLPEYTRLQRDFPNTASQLATIIVRLLVLTTGAISLILEGLFLVLLLLLPDEPSRSLAIKMTMLMLPMMPMVCMTAILGGMLQANGKFGPPAAAPIILNAFQIATACTLYFIIPTEKVTAAYAVGFSAVVASIVQIIWSLHALRGSLVWSQSTQLALDNSRAVFKRFVPAMLGLGTLQLNTMLDGVIAMWPTFVGPLMFGRPVPLDEKSNAILGFTQQFYQFPLGVFGIAVATAIFPLLSRAVDSPNEFAAYLRRGLRLSFYIGLPASIGLVLVRHDLIYVVYSGGDTGFSADGVLRSAAVLLGFAPAVWVYSLNHVLTRAYYAKHDTTTPMRVAIGMVMVNLTLNLTLIWWFKEAGLAWATSISALLQMVILLFLSPRLLGVYPIDLPTLWGFARIVLLGAIMGLAVYAVQYLWPQAQQRPFGWLDYFLRLSVCVIAGGGSYFAASLVLKTPELRWLAQRAPKDTSKNASGGLGGMGEV